jgi:hypothetical protein
MKTEDSTQRARRAIERATEAGCKYRAIAHAVGCDAAHIWRILNEDTRAASADLARRLEEFADKAARQKMMKLAGGFALPGKVVGYYAGPNVEITETEATGLCKMTLESLLAFILDQAQVPGPAETKLGVLLELGGKAKNAYLILADPRFGDATAQVVLHEAEELVATTRRRVGRQQPSQRPWEREFKPRESA